jgi:hypothetical protein
MKKDNHQFVLDTNRPPPPLSALFPAVFAAAAAGGGGGGSGTAASSIARTAANVLSTRAYCGDADATILVSKKSGRFRVQGSTFAPLSLLAEALTSRLRAYHAAGGGGGVVDAASRGFQLRYDVGSIMISRFCQSFFFPSVLLRFLPRPCRFNHALSILPIIFLHLLQPRSLVSTIACLAFATKQILTYSHYFLRSLPYLTRTPSSAARLSPHWGLPSTRTTRLVVTSLTWLQSSQTLRLSFVLRSVAF